MKREKKTAVPSAAETIRENVKAHQRIADLYDARHKEIFNPIEQARLGDFLARAAALVETPGQPKTALDFGCGTGNLTHHLLNLGFHVLSADVTPGFLKMIQRRFVATGRVKTLRLNGVNLDNVPTESVDFAATYSVLHHVPDYLAIVREMARVVKPGGLIFLDHEVQETYWAHTAAYDDYLRDIAPPEVVALPDWRRFLDPRTYWRKLSRWSSPRYWQTRRNLKQNPRYSEEGDIHVWPDDHIEWDKMEERLCAGGCEIVNRTDYLLYKGTYPEGLYRRHENRCRDMRCLVARKISRERG